jgi:hypothetical protein
MTTPNQPKPDSTYQFLSDPSKLPPEFKGWLQNYFQDNPPNIPVGSIVGYQMQRLVVKLENTPQSIPNNSETALTFAVVTSDKQHTFDGTSTIKLLYDGIYLASGFTTWGANTTGARYSTIKQNGVVRAQDFRAATATTAQTASNTIACVIVGKKGDSITRTVFQDSGGSLSTAGTTFELALLNIY